MSTRITLLIAGLALLAGILWYDAKGIARLQHERQVSGEAAAKAHQIARALAMLTTGFEPHGSQAGSPQSGPQVGAASEKGKAQASPKLSPPGVRLLISRDPGLAARYLSAYGASIDARFGLEFYRLGLSAQDETQVRNLLADMEAQRLKLAQMASDQGVDTDDPSLQEVKAQLMSPDRTALKQILTPDQYASLRQYSSDSSIVNFLQEFAGNPNTPGISTDQAAALLPILDSASEHEADGSLISHTINTQAAVAAANGVLSPDQLAAFNAMLLKDQAERQISKATGAN